MNTGIRRKVDDLGRVVIPAGIRRSLSIREGDAVEVHVEGDQVVLCKPTDRCIFCGEEEGLETFREKAVCRGCVAAVGVLDDSVRASRAPQPAVAEVARREPSDLPPWPVGQERGNGAVGRQSTEGGSASRRPAADRGRERGRDHGQGERREPAASDRASGRSRDDDAPGQDPPASTTAW